MFIFSHQDVRRVEDTRYFSYNRMLSNGQLQPIINFGDRLIPDVQLGSLQGVMPQNRPQSTNNIEMTPNSLPSCPIAGISKQMDWMMDRKGEGCAPYPMHHTKTTSMTGIEVKAKPSRDQTQKMTSCCCQTGPLTISQGCNTSLTRIRSPPKVKVTFKSDRSSTDDSDTAVNDPKTSKVSDDSQYGMTHSELFIPPFCKRSPNYKKKNAQKGD